EELAVDAVGRQPPCLQRLVSGPVLARLEQRHGFAPEIPVGHSGSICPAGGVRGTRPRGNLGVVEVASVQGSGHAPKSIVVAVTGASGMAYAVDTLQLLALAGVTTHVVVTAGAKRVLPTETDVDLAQLEALASHVHKDTDLGAAVAPGSFPTDGMVIVPCSAGTLAKVAQGHTDSLVTRAAHVTLKERRPLVLVVREAPYSRPMLVNMLAAHDAGAVVLPASPGFYHRPVTIDDLLGSLTARVLDPLGGAPESVRQWKQEKP